MEIETKGATGYTLTFAKEAAGKFGVRLVILALLSMLLVACDIAALPPAPGQQPGSSSSLTSASSTATPGSAVPGGGSASAPPAATVDAIKAVIQKGNQEQMQAFASNDPSVMSDTSTSAYYQQMVQSYNDMANSGVTALQLVKLTWGPITLQDAGTATANTTETWQATLSDGSTQQQTDANVYTLVVQNGQWKVQDDQHPNSRTLQPQPQPGTSGTPYAAPNPTSVAPAAPTSPKGSVPTPPAVTPKAPGGGSGITPPAAVADAIKAVIQKGNQEEMQAFASHDPSVMADTSTSAYYQQMVQSYNDMANSGVTALKLVKLTWGPTTLQDAGTATANTTETWDTSFSDGSTMNETDANVYTLVVQNGQWKVQDDQHPNSRTLQPQPQPGTPGVAPTPIAPAAPGGTGMEQSSNWAGYTATGGTFTAVSGSWTVPNVSSTTGYGVAADATWVGVGGVGSTDLIQAGTQAEVQSGRIVYSAWWETLPQVSQPVPLDVSAGDSMNVSIVQQTDGTWQIVIKDNTTGQSFQKNVTYRSSLSSAEWIEESPSAGGRTLIPLDNFGTVTFTDASTLENGQQRTVKQAGGQPITMYSSSGQGRYGRSSGQGGQQLAQPSTLGNDGASFSITRTGATAPGNVP